MEPGIESHLIDQLLSALREAPDTRADVVASDGAGTAGRADALVQAYIDGQPVCFVIEAKRSAFPRDVREALWQLRNQMAHGSAFGEGQTLPMIIAESISPGAKALLREERVAYYDTGGSLYVPARGAFLFVDRPLPKRQARSLNAIFAGRRAQVLHAVWASEGEWFGVHNIAERAKVSPATASDTLAALERREWVVAQGAGPAKERRLVDPRALLNAWTDYQLDARPPAWRHYYVPGGAPQDIIHRLDLACADHVAYAVTGPAAAQVYAPYLSTVSQVHCRIAAGAAEAALEALEARPVREGWNLGLMESRSAGDFAFRMHNEIGWLADPLQTYLDLLQTGGRAREAANHLRAELLHS
jgi:hypothetical protein